MKTKRFIQTILLVIIFLIPITAFSADWGWVPCGTYSRFWGIWGSSQTDIFVASWQRYNTQTGKYEDFGEIWHSDGITWSSMPIPTDTKGIYDIWGTSSGPDVFAVGLSGTILHYNGTSWHSETGVPTGLGWLMGVWGSSESDVFAVGEAVGGSGTILHFDGTSWHRETSVPTTTNLHSVWGTSATDVFAVGYPGTILHFNGSAWSTMDSGTSQALMSVWGTSATDVFAVGFGGTILHYNGTNWSPPQGGSGTLQDLYGVWGTPSGTDVYAVGSWGAIVHFNGTSWSPMTSWTTQWLFRVWGSSATDVYAVGDNGIISHYPSYSISGSVKTSEGVAVKDVEIQYYLYNGTVSVKTNSSGNYTIPNLGNGTFTLYPVKTGYNFDPYNLPVTISGANKTGQNFTAYPPGNPELGWGSMDSGTTKALNGVGGKSATNVFAVGDGGKILRYNGTSWHSETGLPTGDELLYGVWASSATNDVFVVGWGGTILHYNGTSWHKDEHSGTSYGYYGVWGSSASDVFAVGDEDTILHYNGTSWSPPMTSHCYDYFAGVWGSAWNNVYAVGVVDGRIARYNGTSWTQVYESGVGLNGVWCSSPSDVFAVSDGGGIFHYNGTSWSLMTSGTTQSIKGVWGSSASDVFAVGYSYYNSIVHYNGTSWSPMENPTALTYSTLNGVWGSSANDVFAVGSAGTILHYTYYPVISGTVSGDVQNINDSVTITLSGPVSKTTTTDSSVNFEYKFSVLSNGTYTVTASKRCLLPDYTEKDCFTFEPASRQVVISGGWSAPGINFTASENLSISGKVTGEIQADVIITISGPVSKATKTVTSGDYSFTGLKSGTYTVTPSKEGYYFIWPNWQGQVTLDTPDPKSVNFTSAAYHSISGTVTLSEGSIGSVEYVAMMVYGSVFGDTRWATTNNASGNYSVPGLKNGTYTVTPRKNGYSFAPENRQVTVSGADVTVENFVATPLWYWSISGTVFGEGECIGSVHFDLSGSSTTDTTTYDSSGNYRFSKLRNGTYTVTPIKTNCSYNPSSLSVSIFDGDAPGKNFTASKASTYSISGKVTCSGVPIAGVPMFLSGSDSGITTTNASGNYSFTVINGTYTVTPMSSTYTFTPPYWQGEVKDGNKANINFACVPPTYSISGTVTYKDSGLAFAGVTMTLSGSMSGTTITGTSGNYTFRGLINGNYIVTPNKTNYTFEPTNRSVPITGASVIGADFKGTPTPACPYSICGTVTCDDKAGLTMTLSGGVSTTTLTDASGKYCFTGLCNGTYIVTPSKTNCTFTPASRQATINGASVTGVDFTCTCITTYSISGTVTGDTQAGVTMSLFGSISTTTITDASGNYRFTGISNGTYTVTPRKSGYSFEPPYRQVTISGANVIGADFTAHIASTYTISGTVTGDTQADVTITVVYDSVLGDTTTNTSGNYTFSGLSNGTYTVKPSKANYTFEPASTQVIISEADVTGVNFVAFAVGGCSTWADVITKYDAYVSGQATWADVIDCYQEYSSTFSISGTVTGGIQAGVTMTLSGDISAITTTTDSSGNYTFSLLSNGSYIVEPSLSNYTFSPASTQVTISGADVTGVNFVAFAVGGCSTWADVNAKYEDYVSGEITWAEFFSCYQEYTTQ